MWFSFQAVIFLPVKPVITVKVQNKGVVGGSKHLSVVAEIKQNQTCQGSDTDTMSCLQHYAVVVGKSAVPERQRIFLCDVSNMLGKVEEGGLAVENFLDSGLKKLAVVDTIYWWELTSNMLSNLPAWFEVGVNSSHPVVGGRVDRHRKLVWVERPI